METEEVSLEKRSCCCGKNKLTIGVLIGLGISFALVALFLPEIYKINVKKKLVLVKDSYAYNMWQHPPSNAIYMRYHVFNYTNFAEMQRSRGKVKPNVTQVGPYVYRELRKNEVIDYNEYNITYVQNYTYIFEPSMSCPTCYENDTVFVPNVVAITMFNEIYDKMKDDSSALIDTMMALSGPPLIKKLTVKQVLWGYDDSIIHMINNLPSFLKSMVKGILKRYGIVVPTLSRVALQHNGTEEANAIGNLTILTGKHDINDVQKIVRWRGLDHAPYWLTKWGRMLNGTDGSHAPPFLKRDQKVYTFAAELCRSLYEVYQKDVKFQDIDMYRFQTTAELFANHSVNPDNIAFCSDNKTCWGSGLLPISKCQVGGPPIFMSSPHFYMADPKLARRINGIQPNKELHETIVDIEPITGITMRAHKRLQINVMARRFWLKVSQSLQHDVNFLPVLMIEERDAIGVDTAAEFRKMVIEPKIMLGYVQYATITLSAVVVLIALTIVGLMISDFYKAAAAASYKEDRSRKFQGNSSQDNSRTKTKQNMFNRESSTVDIIANEFTSDKI